MFGGSLATQTHHRGWILPYLPPVFTLKDYHARSLRESIHVRAYLNQLVRQGKLAKLEHDVYAKLGPHVCFVTFKEDGSFDWGRTTNPERKTKRKAAA